MWLLHFCQRCHGCSGQDIEGEQGLAWGGGGVIILWIQLARAGSSASCSCTEGMQEKQRPNRERAQTTGGNSRGAGGCSAGGAAGQLCSPARALRRDRLLMQGQRSKQPSSDRAVWRRKPGKGVCRAQISRMGETKGNPAGTNEGSGAGGARGGRNQEGGHGRVHWQLLGGGGWG
jgi:hypothetical protein